MAETNNQNLINNENLSEDKLSSPDFSQISETPKKSKFKKNLFIALRVLAVVLVFLIILGAILSFVYYNNFKQANNLALQAKANLELAIHKMVNREFDEAATLINQSNLQLTDAKKLLDEVILVRHIPYIATQIKAVDKVLVSGIKLTDSGERVVLLIHDITEPLQNESITYASISPAQKKEILNKIVESEDLLYEVQGQINEAVIAIDSIPEDKLVKPLREGVSPLKANLPKVKDLIDHVLPMLQVVPKLVGFEEPETYLFLLQNNHELRPTGGFIGTYGILKLQDGEIKEFETDNIYNLDKSAQPILQEPAPEPIAFYLEQKNWALRDSNWSPDFPTAAQKALYFYKEENRILQELKEQGQEIKGDSDTVITDTIPYQPVDGVIAMTPEVIEEILKLTGPVVVNGVRFTAENLQEELEFQVGRRYYEQGIAKSERKEIIKKLADEIKLRIFGVPLHQAVDILQIAYRSLDQKQILIYSKDPQLQQMILERGWGGAIKDAPGDYLLVVDSNLGSLKTDQFVDRFIDYSFDWQGEDLVAKLVLTYKNNADFTWKSTRLRSYTRVYVPAGSQLTSSSGAMQNDKVRDREGTPGEVEISQEYNKTVFGAFISIEPNETGQLIFEYKLPEQVKQQIEQNYYSLLVQKQPGVVHNLTLALDFDKTIESALPAELETEWFNTSYQYSMPLNQDKLILIKF
ncbi:MAG: DUF4012 domain-containing protein [Candidatus Buchananbacteria bacterium]|nr:DUF4012 domain-containing protein [Candidatus Buchananbacteria bacterium]